VNRRSMFGPIARRRGRRHLHPIKLRVAAGRSFWSNGCEHYVGRARVGRCDVMQGVAMACPERLFVKVDLSFAWKIFFVG